MNRFLKSGYLLPVLFFVTLFLYLLRPVGAEQDFWWHISSGRWIWKHGALPDFDPFSLFASSRPDSSELLTLKGYWLSQIIYYLLYLAGGLTAICILGAATMLATVFLVWRILLLQNIPYYVSLIALAPLIAALGFFSEHRPQQYSFMFFALIFYLLERIVSNLKRKGYMGVPAYLVPPVILLWAQMHPGYAIAFPLLVIYLIATFSILEIKTSRKKTAFRFLLLLAGSLLATLAAPNGPAALSDIFSSMYSLFLNSSADAFAFTTVDHNRPWEVAQIAGPWYWRLLFSSLIVALISSIACYKSISNRFIISVAVYALLSLVVYRFGTFFFIAVAVATGYFILFLVRKLPPRAASMTCNVTAAFIMFPLLISTSRHGLVVKGNFTQALVSDRAITFLLASKIPGAVANPYSWGGYLMWRVWPQYRIFSDQRGLGGSQRSEQYKDLMFMEDTSILDRLNINAVVINFVDPVTASLYYGFITLMESETWDLIYYDDISAVFVRSRLDRRLPALKKTDLEHEMTAALLRWREHSPRDGVPCLLLGQIAFWHSNFPEAKRYFDAAAAIDRGNEIPGKWLEALKSAESARNAKGSSR